MDINELKNKVKEKTIKAKDFIWDNRKELSAAAAAVGFLLLAARLSPESDDKNTKYNYDDYDDNFDSDFNEQTQVVKETRSSPEKHMVKPHSQRYGKEKTWKDKDSYPRPRDNDSNE